MIWMMLLAGLAAQDDPAASARAEADALIAAAGAEGVFENVTADSVPTLRHVQSGLTCHFTPGHFSNQIFVPEDEDGRKGEMVGCTTHAQGLMVHVYAARDAASRSADEILQESAEAISEQWPEVQRYEGGFPLLTSPTQDTPPLHAVFTSRDESQPLVTFVLVQHHGDWSYRFRGTGQTDELARAGMAGGMMFMNALSAVPVD